jgi:hypothetical protein
MNQLGQAWGRRRLAAAGLGCVLLACMAGVLAAPASAVEEQTGFLAITEENDSLNGPFGPHTDRHYTQGLKISLFGGDDYETNITATLDRILPAWGIQPQAGDLGWIIIGQNMYTPSNLAARTLIKTDRPYAGWLYTGAVYQRRGQLAPNVAVMENFEVNLGIVGPDSLAEGAQTTVHRWWISNDIPRGWGNQLKEEPGLVLKYARLWRYSPTAATARYIDFIPHIGADVGNVFTFATVGTTLRLGYNLPPDFGMQIIDSPASVNGGLTRGAPAFFFYGFGSVDGRAVGHDITLDGNTFRGGPSVEKNPLVGDASIGLVLQVFRHVEVAYTRIIRTKEFRGQDDTDVFGSITVKGTFVF